MAVDRTFKCDLCRDVHMLSMIGPQKLIGLHWTDNRTVVEANPRQVEHHLCVRCLASIHAIQLRCGQGYECDGGPKCGSDHK